MTDFGRGKSDRGFGILWRLRLGESSIPPLRCGLEVDRKDRPDSSLRESWPRFRKPKDGDSLKGFDGRESFLAPDREASGASSSYKVADLYRV